MRYYLLRVRGGKKRVKPVGQWLSVRIATTRAVGHRRYLYYNMSKGAKNGVTTRWREKEKKQSCSGGHARDAEVLQRE